MVYAARYSTTIEKDIELNFSCWLGDLGTDLVSALEYDGYNQDELEAKYERFSDNYDSFEDYLRTSVLPNSTVVWDERFQAYRSFHHSGLSCWALEAETEAAAVEEARNVVIDMTLGQQTIGNIRIVAEVSPNLYVLECDAYANES